MTAKADMTEQEWELVLKAPPSAGMIVITAQRGGAIRESLSIAAAYAEARQQHGQSQLLDEIVAAKPGLDHTRYRSPEELKEHALGRIREALDVLERKVQAQELAEYKAFILNLAVKVASAHREGAGAAGPVSDAERAAISEIQAALG